MKMKYIIVKDGGLELAMIFNPIINHSSVGHGWDLVSAGFCNIGVRAEGKEPTWACWGESVTLKIKSRGEKDDEVLNQMMVDF